MAFELPQHIKDLAIPQNNDVRGGFSVLGGEFSNKANTLTDKEHLAQKLEQQRASQRDHELSVSGQAENAGRRTTGAGAALGMSRDAAEDKAEKEKSDRAELMRHLAMLDREVNYYSGQMEQAQASLNAQDILDNLHEQGLLDPDNPDHQKHFKAAGLDPDDYRMNGGDALKDNRDRLQDWYDDSKYKHDKADNSRRGITSQLNEINGNTGELTPEKTKAIAAKALSEADAQPDSAARKDQFVTEVKNVAVNVEINKQRGFKTEEAVDATSAMSDDVSAKITETSFSASSMFGASPIQTGLDPKSNFNSAAMGNAEIMADNTNEADNLFSQDAVITSEGFLPLGQNL